MFLGGFLGVLGCSWGGLGDLERCRDVLGRVFGGLGGVLGWFWNVLGRSWDGLEVILGRSWNVLERFWNVSGRSWDVLKWSWGRSCCSWWDFKNHCFFICFSLILRGVLGGSRVFLGALELVLKGSWVVLGSSWVVLGGLLGGSWRDLKFLNLAWMPSARICDACRCFWTWAWRFRVFEADPPRKIGYAN